MLKTGNFPRGRKLTVLPGNNSQKSHVSPQRYCQCQVSTTHEKHVPGTQERKEKRPTIFGSRSSVIQNTCLPKNGTPSYLYPGFFLLSCLHEFSWYVYILSSKYIYTLQLAPLPLAETLVLCPFACALNRDRCRGYGGAPILLQPPGLADLGLGGPLARRRQPLKPLLFEHMLGLSIRVAVSVFSKSVLLGRCLEVPDYKPGTSEPRAKKWCAAFPTVPCVWAV